MRDFVRNGKLPLACGRESEREKECFKFFLSFFLIVDGFSSQGKRAPAAIWMDTHCFCRLPQRAQWIVKTIAVDKACVCVCVCVCVCMRELRDMCLINKRSERPFTGQYNIFRFPT